MTAYADSTNQTYSENDMNQAWVLFDSDSDGNISADEFTAAIEEQESLSSSLVQLSASQKTNVIFQLYDKNNDSFLTLGEVTQILNDSIGGTTSKDAKWLIKSLDINGDGKLAWFEIYTALK